MAISVSFINTKGGVGKTTLAVQVAYAADKAGYKTLVVDLDPQSNLSQSLLTPEKYVRYLKQRKPTVVQIFDRYMPLTRQIPTLRLDTFHQACKDHPYVRLPLTGCSGFFPR